jgi:cobalt-zinc-cadmium efflux system outer membrane protein
MDTNRSRTALRGTPWIMPLVIAGCAFGHSSQAAPMAAAQRVLSEDQVLGLFYARNLELISAAFGLETARAEKIVAAAIPNPELNLYSQEIAPHYVDPRFGPAIYVTVEQLIETAGKRRLRTESSMLGAEAAESDLRDAARTLSQTVRRAHYELLLSQKKFEVAQGQLDHVNELVKANQERLELGDIAERDAARIQVEAAEVASELDQAGAELEKARAQLAVLLAWPKDSDQLAAADRWPSGDTFRKHTNVAAATIAALDQRPDLQAARLRQQQAKKDVELAKAGAIPNVTVSAGFGHDWGNMVTNAATLSLHVPMPIFYQNEGQIAQAGIRSNDAEVAIRRTENSTRAEVTTALAAWQATDAVVHRFETEVIKRAEYIRDSAEYAYSQGGTDIIDLIQAQRDFRAALFDYFQAQANRAYAYADLKMALADDGTAVAIAPEASP